MKEFLAGKFDIAVIGAGHAGIEAALAAARLGLETVCLHHQSGRGGQHALQPRHRRHRQGPSWSGSWTRWAARWASAADRACIQYRMLNRGKGPAVWSLRAQADRRQYQRVDEAHAGAGRSTCSVRQGGGRGAARRGRARRAGCAAHRRGVSSVRAAILCTGTYLHGRHHRGRVHRGLRPRRDARRRCR
ncbi:MAG: FAD-dependent oxidoreductase [Oscillospiraceae bacterium]